jgi:molybdenum cofactor biosynthesis enzyme MoaA
MNEAVRRNKEAILRACKERRLQVEGLPFYYALHPTLWCNQRCIMCTPDGKHLKDTLPFDQCSALLQRIRPFAEHVTLTGGEPLLYPWIRKVVELLAASEVSVSITTNATMLSEELATVLLGLRSLELKCSIDAATPATYFKIRGTNQFERVLTNLAGVAALARDKPSVRLILVYVVMRENLGEVLPFIDLAKPLAPYRIEFHPVRHVAGWVVDNGTGWVFRDREQCCEFFRDEYNALMDQAAAKCTKEGLRHEVLHL